MEERRVLPRWKVQKQVRAWLPQAQEFTQCILEDINLKGICASFNKRLPNTALMSISLDLEDNLDLMKLEVALPWAKEDQGRYVYGMSLNRIAETDKDRMYQYICRHCSQQMKDSWWAV